MEENIFIKIEDFVTRERWEYDFPLLRSTQLEKDLRITGDDAIEFIIAYGKKFDVDVSNFMAADYFEGEGIDFLKELFVLIGLSRNNAKKNLTLGDLEKGIITGKLDEETINSF
jgi:hypothetical protein